MKRIVYLLFMTLLPIMVMAQASGGQVTRPVKKQQNVQNTGSKSSNNRSNLKVYREVYYEATLSVEERKVWEDEKAKAKEIMRLLAYNLKRQNIIPSGNFVDGLAPCDKGYIDQQGNLVIHFSQYQHYEFHNGYAIISNGKKYGIIDKKGNIIIPLKYDDIFNCEEGLFCVEEEGRSGYINANGEIIIPIIYDETRYITCWISEGLARVCKNNKYGYVDKTGRNVIPIDFEDAGNFQEGLAPVKKNGKWGYINKYGNIVVPFLYDDALEIHCGLGLVEINNKKGYVDINGNIAIPIKYEKKNQGGLYVEPLSHFSDEMACVLENDKYGYINKHGRKVIHCIYKSRKDFSEGLALVAKDSISAKYGLINKKGQVVAPFIFPVAPLTHFSYSEGLMYVYGETHDGYYIDKYGNSTIDFE